MIRLFASDLDGTLLNEQHECDERISQGIKELIEKGKVFTVATGRGFNMVQLNEAAHLSHYICLNGATIIDPNGKLLHSEHIDKDVLSEMLDTFEDLHLEFISWNRIYSTYTKQEVIEYRTETRKKIFGKPMSESFLNNLIDSFVFSQSKETILKQDICKINYHDDGSVDLSKLNSFLKNHKMELVNAPSGKGLYEITKYGVNKATGIRWLANHLSIKESEVAVYGDGGNDLEMLESFDHSYAPSTGSIEAKEKAKQIIGPYYEYSVIDHMLKIK